MRFTRMHGLGNDFIVLDAVAEPDMLKGRDVAELTRAMTDRRTGIGADGVIIVSRPDGFAGPDAQGSADVRMRIINSDGSEPEICGNGTRCVAKLAYERGYACSSGNVVRLQTALAVLPISVEVAPDGRVTGAAVDMGAPDLEPSRLPFLPGKLDRHDGATGVGELGGFRARFVSMGNPHAVLFVDRDPASIPLETLGPTLETHPAFPRRANINLVDARTKGALMVRTWERGAGLTLACGTGACASVVAACLEGRLERGVDARVTLPGGELRIRWDNSTGHVIKTGPATEVCTGDWLEQPRPPVAHAADTITTDRLVLRPLRREDAPAIQAFCSERELAAQTLSVPHPYPPGAALEHLARVMGQHERGESAAYAITLKGSGVFIGSIGLRMDTDRQVAELGYYVGKPYRGSGYCSEAAKALTCFAFERLALRRVFAQRRGRNPASGRVLEKAGFTREGALREHAIKWGEPDDLVCYGVLRIEAGKL